MTENGQVQSAHLSMGKRIRLARHEAGWTQQQLADRSGITQPMVARYERENSHPTSETYDKIMAVLATAGATTVMNALDGALGIQGRTAGKLSLVDPMAKPRPVEWLAEGFLARRFVTMIAGQEGAGKSAVTQTLAVALADGKRQCMGMRLPGVPLRGLILDAENVMVIEGEGTDGSLAQSRLQSFGLSGEASERITLAGSDGFDLDKDYASLDTALSDMAKNGTPVDFIILDSFTSLWFGNENVVDDVRRVLTKLNRIAVRHNVGVLLIHHTNKAGDAYRGTSAIGSTIAAVFTFARVIWRDPDSGKKAQHPTARFLAVYKMRLAAEPKPRLVHITGEGVMSTSNDMDDEWTIEGDDES